MHTSAKAKHFMRYSWNDKNIEQFQDLDDDLD